VLVMTQDDVWIGEVCRHIERKPLLRVGEKIPTQQGGAAHLLANTAGIVSGAFPVEKTQQHQFVRHSSVIAGRMTARDAAPNADFRTPSGKGINQLAVLIIAHRFFHTIPIVPLGGATGSGRSRQFRGVPLPREDRR
jgi:hypothetical protein